MIYLTLLIEEKISGEFKQSQHVSGVVPASVEQWIYGQYPNNQFPT